MVFAAMMIGALAFASPAVAGSKRARSKKKREAPKTTVADAPPSLQALMAAFRASPGTQADFVEEKRMALLAAPLKSVGTLYFAPPGRLARHITKPSRSTVIVDAKSVQIDDGKTVQRIDLAAKPVIRRFVQSFVLLLKGDEAGLRKTYGVLYMPKKPSKPGEKASWTLVLSPRVAPLNKVVKTLTMNGRGLVVSRMTMVENDGDSTVTRFSNVNPQRRFSAADTKRYFTVPKR